MPIFFQIGTFDKFEKESAIKISIEEAESGSLPQTIVKYCQQLNHKLFTAFTKYDKKQNGKVNIEKLEKIISDAGLTIMG